MKAGITPDPLPPGWQYVRLGDVCDLNPRRPEITRDGSAATSFIQMTSVSEAGKGIALIEQRPFSEVQKGYTYFRDGDVLFAKITPCMQNGKHAVVEGLIEGFGFGSTEFHVIRPSPVVTASWLLNLVVQPWVLRDAVTYMTGAVGQQRVPTSYLASLMLPLPPVHEQQRLATILTEQLTAVNRARAAAEAQLQAVGELSAAYLRAVFESKEASTWPIRSVAEIAATGSGSTPHRGRADYYEGTIPWVKTGELRDNITENTEEHISESALHNSSLKLLPPGTVLVAMYGQGQTRGRTTLLAVPATTNQACFAILPNPTLFDPAFVQYWFRHSYARLRKETEGRGGNQPNLNGDVLRQQRLLLPSVNRQCQLVMQLNERIATTQRLRAALQTQLDTLSTLPAVLLRQAFAGKLSRRVFVVPQSIAGKTTASAQTAIAAYIVQKISDSNTLGRVKLQKLLYLAETHIGIEFGAQYERAAAGPYNRAFMAQLESEAAALGWIITGKRDGRIFYTPGARIMIGLEEGAGVLGNMKAEMDRVLQLLHDVITREVEAVVTLFAAWNDFLLDGEQPDDSRIVAEVLENWHQEKAKFTSRELYRDLRWLRNNAITPQGIGPHTTGGLEHLDDHNDEGWD